MKTKLIFFGCCLLSGLFSSQSPGGVSTNLKSWFKENGANTSTSWKENSSANNATGTATYNITGSDLINFNPTYSFNGSSNRLDFPAALDVSGAYTLIGIAKPKNTNPGRIFTSANSNQLFGYYSTGEGSFYMNGNPGYISIGSNNVIAKTTDLNLFIVTRSATGAVVQRKNGAVLNSNASSDATAWRMGIGGSAVFGEYSNVIVPEFISYSSDQTANIAKLESYLAIKYGMTLNNGASNYVNAAGSIIWNATANAGYISNIAGIARDDASSLYQKQAMSQNTGSQLLIGAGGALADTNALNTNSLSDGQYLIVGDNGLAKSLSVAISGISGVNYRFPAIWKAQNTGNVGVVRVLWPQGITNIKLIQSADAVFDNTDTVTDMSANTQVINGNIYNYADVSIADGQYFSLAGYATAPGGVVGVNFWVKSDDAGNIATAWKDQSANSNPIENVGGVTLGVADAAHNFNPYVAGFTSSKYFRDATSSLNTSNSGTPVVSSTSIFSAMRRTSAASGRIVGIDNDDILSGEPGVSLNNSGQPYFYKYSNGSGSNASTLAVTTNQSAVASWIADNTTNNLGISLNGSNQNFTRSGFGIVGQILMLGYGSFDLANPFPGDIMEVVWYNKTLTANERDRVNTYLAIKNGVTLSNDYLSTNSTVVFSQTNNAGYTSNIVGIARDNVEGLYQKQANSINAGNQLLIGVGGALADTNALNTNSLSDGQYLIVGDNGLAKSLGVAISGISGVNNRFSAIWKAQNTGNVGVVRVLWKQGITNIKLIQSADAVFDNTDTVTDMSANTQVINGNAYNYADVSIADGQYFTLAGASVGPGGVMGVDFWVKSDDAGNIATAWKDQSTNSNPIENVGGVTLGAADAAHNFNPYVTGFTSSKYFRDATSSLNTSNSGTPVVSSTSIFSAMRRTSAASGRIVGIDNEDLYGGEPGVSLNNSGQPYFYKYSNGSGSNASTLAVTTNQSAVASWIADNTSSTLGISLNGVNQSFNRSGFGIVGQILMLGNGTWDLANPFPGDIMEVVWYNKTLTANERDRVNTYLAIKNGVTLSNDYLSTNSTVVFSQTNNAGYTSNIAGIARDNVEGLHQKQANSVNVGDQLLIGAGGALADTNALNTNSLSDGQHLIWGDNGLARTLSVPISGIPSVNNVFPAIWKAQNTGNVGVVRVLWKQGVTNIKLIQSADAVFDNTDAVTDMSANTQVINGNTYNYADVSIADGQYFTFAGFVSSLGVSNANVSKLDFGIYPNPVSDVLTVHTDKRVNKIEIIDFSGRTIKTSNEKTNKIYVAELQSGVYFARITIDNVSYDVKFIKK